MGSFVFFEVQDVLNGRKRMQFVKASTPENLPLRGYLLCPKCGKVLTGSASKGRNDYYHYYHCNATCGVRFKAGKANQSFVDELRKFIPKPGIADLFRYVVNEVFNPQNGSHVAGRKDLLNRIQIENERLSKARKLLLDEAIDGADYKVIKAECETKLLSLEAKLTNFGKSTFSIESVINQTIGVLSNLDTVYIERDFAEKREIIGSIYPEKLSFDGFNYRTVRLNDAGGIILMINSDLGGKKIRTNRDFSSLSCSVALTGQNSNRFFEDLKRLADIVT